jgi:hypothetical protein
VRVYHELSSTITTLQVMLAPICSKSKASQPQRNRRSPLYRRNNRDSFDEGSVTTAMTDCYEPDCYEPSEASIEWSVTTVDDETKKVFPAARATRCFGREENGVGGGY